MDDTDIKIQHNEFAYYDLKISQVENSWKRAYVFWLQDTGPKVLLFIIIMLVSLMAIGFALTFTILPQEYRMWGIWSSFFPMFLLTCLIGVTLEGVQHGDNASKRCQSCANCIWNSFFCIAFWSRCNKQALGTTTQFDELKLVSRILSGKENANENIFHIPSEIVKTRMHLHRARLANNELLLMLPFFLVTQLKIPKVISLIISFFPPYESLEFG